MSDLPPPSDAAEVVHDVNDKATKTQRSIWLVGAGLAGVVALGYIWFTFKTPTEAPATAQRVTATADVLKTGDTAPEVVNGDLAREVENLKTENARLQTDALNYKTQVDQAAGERADAQNVISTLQDELNKTRARPSAAPAGGTGSVVGGGQGSPAFGPFPAAPLAPTPTPAGAGAGGVPLEYAASQVQERPRRSFSTVRAIAPARAADAGSDGDRASASNTSGDFANKPGATGVTKTGAAGASYFSGKLTGYQTVNYVPPNAYATAKVLVGVDGAAGIAAQADPKPVLFRITGPAVSVGVNGRYQSTDLRGCLVNGAAYAELSSEKVYVKLQRISCPLGKDKFSVATVEGYATQYGKAGVRGRVVERSGGLTGRAALAGSLQGLGQALSSNYRSAQGGINAVAGAGGLLGGEKLSSGEIAQGSVASGVSNAASMLADYYIKRAEQYQPVIEMPTGMSIEVVFLSGFQVKGD
ncbi:TrbI/VirB10 family protein [Caulobacter sp. CCH9-E1]|uniref:TrbI/VirB10 family protein n=1 Tax=Caulobacter sp. CCH9-E1 TaxID=1768768 RepID=UPI00082DC6AC|nr:TrbI/VirB10 family protein [Caulobacter sp. CCH9-E1]